MRKHLPEVLISVPDGVIDLGWGHPSPRLHPVAALQKAAAHVFSVTQVKALQYGATQGYGKLLESLASFLSNESAYSMRVEPETLFLTSGASQALDMASTLFAREGDTVYVEEPTYYLIKNIFEDHHLSVVGVPTDADGLRTDALEAMLNDASQPNPTLLYIIPTFQNPTGSVFSVERRRKLAELANRHDFMVLADEVYQLLHYGPPPPPPIVAFDDSESGCVISLGSFSKILSPGLRLGWVQAHRPLIERLVNAGMVMSGGGLNHFTSTLVHATLELGLLEKNIATLRTTYGERVQALTKALEAYMPEVVDYAIPGGGYFFWLTCSPHVDAEKLLPLANEAGVSYRPGQVFSATRGFSNAMRLSFALYESEELEQGIARLANAFKVYHASTLP